MEEEKPLVFKVIKSVLIFAIIATGVGRAVESLVFSRENFAAIEAHHGLPPQTLFYATIATSVLHLLFLLAVLCESYCGALTFAALLTFGLIVSFADPLGPNMFGIWATLSLWFLAFLFTCLLIPYKTGSAAKIKAKSDKKCLAPACISYIHTGTLKFHTKVTRAEMSAKNLFTSSTQSPPTANVNLNNNNNNNNNHFDVEKNCQKGNNSSNCTNDKREKKQIQSTDL